MKLHELALQKDMDNSSRKFHRHKKTIILMKIKVILYLSFLWSSFIMGGCAKDNFEPPKSTLIGRLVYNGEPIGVRSGGVAFELWQHGYQLFSKIPLNIAQDGSFSAVLFDGKYKLVRSVGSGPWLNQTDSIDVELNGNATLDVPVEPYYVIKDLSFVKEGVDVKATFTVQTVNNAKALELVRLYIGPNLILDQNNNAANKQALSSVIDSTKPITLSVSIPTSLALEDYLFARVGVKVAGIAELLYSSSEKIQIK